MTRAQRLGLGLKTKTKHFYSTGVNYDCHFSGLYYKHVMIVNDDARIINKLDASLTDDARVVIYDRPMFIVQATDRQNIF
jgi:hypothetical protein